MKASPIPDLISQEITEKTEFGIHSSVASAISCSSSPAVRAPSGSMRSVRSMRLKNRSVRERRSSFRRDGVSTRGVSTRATRDLRDPPSRRSSRLRQGFGEASRRDRPSPKATARQSRRGCYPGTTEICGGHRPPLHRKAPKVEFFSAISAFDRLWGIFFIFEERRSAEDGRACRKGRSARRRPETRGTRVLPGEEKIGRVRSDKVAYDFFMEDGKDENGAPIGQSMEPTHVGCYKGKDGEIRAS
jgi:hypothetical protein